MCLQKEMAGSVEKKLEVETVKRGNDSVAPDHRLSAARFQSSVGTLHMSGSCTKIYYFTAKEQRNSHLV